MILQEIVDRIASDPAHPFALVEGAAELANLTDGPAAYPAAYVYVKEEAAAENMHMTGAVLQRVEADVAVLIIAQSASDATGSAASDVIEGLKKALRKRLLGWEPASCDDVITSVGGGLIRMRHGELRWEETFAAAYLIESEADDA